MAKRRVMGSSSHFITFKELELELGCRGAQTVPVKLLLTDRSTEENLMIFEDPHISFSLSLLIFTY
jgi:hypothetical protein